MENATKALLIAAAVLVAVLIISLGIVVYNKAAEAVDNAGNLNEYQIQQFNEKFTKYEGTNKSGSEVNALLQTALNHNNAQETTDTCVKITVKDKNGTTSTLVENSNEITSTPAKQNVGSRYTVTCTINKKTKLVHEIAVSVNTDTP